MSTRFQKPSLIEPDFSGLWSVARLGHNKKWYSKALGTIIMLLLIYSWIGGYLMPLFILYLLKLKYVTTSIILASLTFVPYFLTIGPLSWVCRFYMLYGSSYFAGGTSMSFENIPPVRPEQHPIMNAIHSHGVFCLGYLLTCGVRFRAIQDVTDKNIHTKYTGKIMEIEHIKDRFPIAGFAVDYLIYAPLFNFFFTKLTGCLMDASNDNMKAYMRTQRSFGILPGGFNEASLFEHGVNIIYIKSRKGFIKYCLKYGYELWPCFIFGECMTYRNLFACASNSWMDKAKTWLSDHKIPTVFPIGSSWWNLFLPSPNTGLHSIYSGNTRYAKIEEPTQEQIDECHQWYMDEVNALFERHKWRFGYEKDIKLKIL